MKKLYLAQSFTILFLLFALLKGTYSQIMYFSEIIPFSLLDLFIYLFILISLYFSFKRKVYSSIIICIYSLFTLIKIGNISDIPVTIFNSISNANFQLAAVLLFLCITLVLSIVIFILWLLKFSSNNNAK